MLLVFFFVWFRDDGGGTGEGGGLPSPKTSSFSLSPVATLPSSGSRLNGTPWGSSPMMPLGCAPHGLKYRSSPQFHFSNDFPAFLRLFRCASM